MKTFRTKTYRFETEKIKNKNIVRLAVLADLHGLVFGNENQELFHAIETAEPDAVLVAGDMVVSSDPSTAASVTGFFCRLANRFPVFYAMGNHEYKMRMNPGTEKQYLAYEHVLTRAGVCFLHNEHVITGLKGTDFVFYGLELPVEYYKKPKSPYPDAEYIRKLLGSPNESGISVLLAHNPKYGNAYFEWGADLTLSGHYHGGVLRFSEHYGLACPQYLFLPPFCCGDFHKNGHHMLVSAGLGEHTVPVRIHNPRELIFAELAPPENKQTTGENIQDGNTR